MPALEPLAKLKLDATAELEAVELAEIPGGLSPKANINRWEERFTSITEYTPTRMRAHWTQSSGRGRR